MGGAISNHGRRAIAGLMTAGALVFGCKLNLTETKPSPVSAATKTESVIRRNGDLLFTYIASDQLASISTELRVGDVTASGVEVILTFITRWAYHSIHTDENLRPPSVVSGTPLVVPYGASYPILIGTGRIVGVAPEKFLCGMATFMITGNSP